MPRRARAHVRARAFAVDDEVFRLRPPRHAHVAHHAPAARRALLPLLDLLNHRDGAKVRLERSEKAWRLVADDAYAAGSVPLMLFSPTSLREDYDGLTRVKRRIAMRRALPHKLAINGQYASSGGGVRVAMDGEPRSSGEPAGDAGSRAPSADMGARGEVFVRPASTAAPACEALSIAKRLLDQTIDVLSTVPPSLACAGKVAESD